MKRKIAFFAVLVSVVSILMLSACESEKASKPSPKDKKPVTGENTPIPNEDIPVIILSIEQTGGSSGSVESAGLIINFDIDPTTLTADDITVIGATKGTLSTGGTERTLVITNITVENEESVSVTIASPEGFSISESPMTAVVYNLVIGMDYLGGKLAYVFKEGDQGFVSGETHGIIAATEDLTDTATWIEDKFLWDEVVTGGTLTSIGSGFSNTETIIEFVDDNRVPKYAALLTREYRGGGYSDWYLPSKDELNILYINKALIGTFDDDFYWSSSEESGEAVWTQNLHSGMQYRSVKYENLLIRPVRSF